MKEQYKNQREYYWRHRQDILDKLAEKRKDPEYRKHRTQVSLKSYYKRKERNNARTEDEI